MNKLLHLIEFVFDGPPTAWRLWRDIGLSPWSAVKVAWLSLSAYDRDPFEGPGRVQRFGRRVLRLRDQEESGEA